MKKGLLVLLFICSSSIILNAQLISGYGIKAGLCIANQDFDYGDSFSFDTDYLTGLKFGAFIEFYKVSYFNLLLEVSYAQKGNKEFQDKTGESGEDLGKITYENRVNYLEINTLGKFSTRLSSFKPYIIFGPRIDIFLGFDDDSLWSSVYDDFEKVDLGLSAGLGTEFQLTEFMAALIEFRYSPSITNSFKNDYLKVKNTSWELLTGLKF